MSRDLAPATREHRIRNPKDAGSSPVPGANHSTAVTVVHEPRTPSLNLGESGGIRTVTHLCTNLRVSFPLVTWQGLRHGHSELPAHSLDANFSRPLEAHRDRCFQNVEEQVTRRMKQRI
jgi:hypothetical protein